MRKLAIASAALFVLLAACKEQDEAGEGEASATAAVEPAPEEDASPEADAALPVLGTERVRLVEAGAPIREVAWSVPGGEAELRIEAGACGAGAAACEMQLVAALGDDTYRLHRFSPVSSEQTIEAMLDGNGHPHVLLISWESERRETEANTLAVRLTWDGGAGRPRAGGTWEMPGADPDPDTIDLGEGH